TAGLVSAGNAQGLQLRASAAGTLWLACFKAGATDTTYVYSRLAGGNWTPMGVLEGRLVDMELDDIGEPAVLLAHAPAILHRQGGIWQSLTPFSNPDEDHIAMQMLYDGSGTGAMVLRRDTSDGLTVEQLSFGNWTQLGTAGFATGDAADLGLSHSGIAHVVSVDHATNGPPRAYQFVAGNWQLLGGQFVFNNTVSQPQWAFDPGAAYLAFRDDEQALRNSVMYLGSPNAVVTSHLSGNLRLWPNPAGATLHLELEKPIRHSEILITDALGRIVHQDKTSAENFIALDVRSLPAGQYFLTLLGRHGPSLHGAFFKLQ
ncbi:MAG TPA: T9SS type A sorting domain-containing protein, partial [Bacteroidia bacterium]|nr:T9SS type A sorting domain-containing protein [Bacteroidia bacterium]